MRRAIEGARWARWPLFSLALIYCVAGVAGYQRVYPSPRIILGREVNQFNVSSYCTLFVEFPSDDGTSLCGCVVYAPGLALSAAHCFQKGAADFDGKEFFSAAHVRLYGQTHAVSAALTRVALSTVFVHPEHSSVTLQNDIAVFRLPMDSSTEYVELNENSANWDNLGSTDRLTVVGIGRVETGILSMVYASKGKLDPLSLGIPLKASLSRRACLNPSGYGQLAPWSKEVTYGDICAGPFDPCVEGRCADSCNGDSGGPLYMRSEDSPDGVTKLFGIVSRGWECGITGGYPGIYSPVHAHLEFIHESVGTQATVYDEPLTSKGAMTKTSSGSFVVLVSVTLTFLVFNYVKN